jgi:acyl carrier protein
MTAQTPFEAELARLIVEAVNLEMPAAELDPEAPLYGEGLGLDSIDMLEISLAIGKAYGVALRADDEANRQIFASLRNLAQHVERHRRK